jgi:hypothetical protein
MKTVQEVAQRDSIDPLGDLQELSGSPGWQPTGPVYRASCAGSSRGRPSTTAPAHPIAAQHVTVGLRIHK